MGVAAVSPVGALLGAELGDGPTREPHAAVLDVVRRRRVVLLVVAAVLRLRELRVLVILADGGPRSRKLGGGEAGGCPAAGRG